MTDQQQKLSRTLSEALPRTGGHTGRIDVISCGIGFPLAAGVLSLLKDADVVYGSRALLAACPVVPKEARVIGASARDDAAGALAMSREGRRIVALASGDALYHGFGGTLAGMRLPGDSIVYHPGVTAFQALFHRLGLAWQDARLFCAHSARRLPARNIAEAPLSVTYAGSRHPASAIARAVIDCHPPCARRAALIAEHLGAANERIISGLLEDMADIDCGPTSMLVLFPDSYDGRLATAHAACPPPNACLSGCPPPPALALGLPEDEYDRENNLITASDVRAVILARLRLPAWGALWDIGAGSGSVGLEAAALRPDLAVHAVERKPERSARIERNRARLGVANYTLHIGDALEVLDDPALPAPDRVFIGGGGEDLPALLTACMERLRPGGLMAASAVTLESFALLLAWRPDLRGGLCRLDIANEAPIAGKSRHLKHQNTIHVFTFHKENTV